MRKFLAVLVSLAVLAIFIAPASLSAAPATQVTKNCTENSGNQFRIGATPAYSYRVDNLHVHLDFYSEIPVTVKVYTESGYVETLYDESGGYFGATIPSALHHTWSAGSYGWGSYSWISSTGLGNHCGSNFVDIV